MDIQITQMRPEDADAKGYIHWKSWQETYPGLIPADQLEQRTLTMCQANARRQPENTLILKLDGKAVGFARYSQSDPDSGEINALYLLKEVQGLGLGKQLMHAAIQKIDRPNIILWVLKGNNHAIGFYEHCGFHMDGAEKAISVGTALRMVYHT